jgi:hypothetical protein
MAQAQTRLSDHIDVFYGASDRTSDGAMAAHAYKRSVEELDAGISRELVRARATPHHRSTQPLTSVAAGRAVSYNDHGAARQNVRLLSRDQRPYREAE